MSRMNTRSQSNKAKPTVIKNKTKPKSKKSKTKPAEKKIAVPSQVWQANDVPRTPKILITNLDLQSLNTLIVSDNQRTSKSIGKVFPIRRATINTDTINTETTTESGLSTKQISSRRKTINTDTVTLPVRRSERILSKTSKPIYVQPKISGSQKREAYSLSAEIPKSTENLPPATKISKRRKIIAASNEHKEPAAAQPPDAIRKQAVLTVVHSSPVEIQKLNENSPPTSAMKISKRRKIISASNNSDKITDAQPTPDAKRKLPVHTAVHPSPVVIQKVNGNLPPISATNRRRTRSATNELKKLTDTQPRRSTRNLSVRTAVHPSPVDIQKVNGNFPPISATNRRRTRSVSNQLKTLTDAQPTDTTRNVPVPTAGHLPSVEIRKVHENSTKEISEGPQTIFVLNERTEAHQKKSDPTEVQVNENLPSTSTTNISRRRKTILIRKEDRKPIDAQRKLAVPTVVHPSPVELEKVNESLSTSVTRTSRNRTTFASNGHKEPKTLSLPIHSDPIKFPPANQMTEVHAKPIEIPNVNEDLPITSTTQISEGQKIVFVSNEPTKPTDAQLTTAYQRVAVPTEVQVNENLQPASMVKISKRLQTINRLKERKKSTDPKRKLAIPTAVHPSPVEIQKVNENLQSTLQQPAERASATNITKRRENTFVSKAYRRVDTGPSTPVDIQKVSENLPSTSASNIAKIWNATLVTKPATQVSTVPSILAKIPNGNSPSTSNVVGSEDKIEIIIPNELKKLLIDDVNAIKRQKHYKIPATQSVAQIIEQYVALKQTARQDENYCGFEFKQIFDDILEYFDALIGCQLLYESELIQYLGLMNDFPGENMSTLYPPIYLLRLLVRLNALLQYSCTDKQTLRYIVSRVNDFAKYLSENKSIFSDMNIFC